MNALKVTAIARVSDNIFIVIESVMLALIEWNMQQN
jgi:hypothetical protein